MTVLASGVEEILQKLLFIAGGDPALVQNALAHASRNNETPKLEEIVDYIEAHRAEAEQAATPHTH